MPAPGDLIGPYRLVSELGKGAMGEVWRARDERLDRYVALKILPAELARDVERRARVLREARAAAAIRHANVVTLFDIVEHRGDDILVMELVEGRTLSDTLRKDGAPTLEVGLRWIEGIADALVAAHARGILHRDIKAANIMVTAEGGVKVLDFGLAKLRDGNAPVVVSPHVPPPVREEKLALDETMPSQPKTARSPATPPRRHPSALDTTASPEADIDSYQTQAGSLIGTPLYMSPEQIDGAPPDEKSEVFSVGVLAHEILAGKPPYTATSMDALFKQIKRDTPPTLDQVPAPIAATITKALAKNPAERLQSMSEFRDAIAAQRRRLFSPRARRWPLAAAAVILIGGVGAGLWWPRSHPDAPAPSEPAAVAQPGDDYVARALQEYDVFYNDKALSSLRAAIAVAPEHPRANAYLILFGGASDSDLATAAQSAAHARLQAPEHSKDRALLDAAIALVQRGSVAARAALAAAGAESDRELAFWTAELDFRSSKLTDARDEYRALLEQPAEQFRGRIYDHYSAVLLYLDEPTEALRIGTLYRKAFPGEADAVGVHATTLAAAGQLDEAATAAETAVRLSEGEDTLAGLAKVFAIKGDHKRARELYQRSLDRAGPSRRPVRRAALAFLQWIDGDTDAAIKMVAPCLRGGADSTARERGACLFVAGIVDYSHAEDAARELDALAAEATDLHLAYGAPASLATLVRARTNFFGGGCVVDPQRSDAVTPPSAVEEAAYQVPLDFYAAYHVPFFATWALCERAALLASHGDRAGAAALLEPVAARAPNREWLITAIASYK